MDMKERIRRKLAGVNDPGTNMDVMTIGLVTKLEVSDAGAVNLEFRPSSPECPMVVPLAFRIKDAIEEIEGIYGVTISVVDHRMSDEVTAMINEKEQ